MANDEIIRAAEDAVSTYLAEFGPGAAWDDSWFTEAFETDSTAVPGRRDWRWIDYRDAAIAALRRAQAKTTGVDGDAPAYGIQARTRSTPWSDEGSGDTWSTREEAEAAMAKLEPANDDGDALEYRVVER